jgi:hypothetical protein
MNESCLLEVSHDFFKVEKGYAVHAGNMSYGDPARGVLREFAHEEKRKILVFSEPH